MIYLIVAMSKNNVIGLKNNIPWDIPIYKKWFNINTFHGTVIMGYNTYKSNGLLPGRRNIVISRQAKPVNVHVDWYNHLEVALKSIPPMQDAYIIGGVELFITAMQYVDSILLTRIHKDVKGDVFLNLPKTKLVWSQKQHNYSFEIHKCIKN